MHPRRKVITTLIILILFIIISQTVRSSIQNSLILCSKLLIPSLFPFFILSGMLFDFGIDTIFPPTFCCFMIGLFSGFPIGTKCLCSAYRHNNLTRKQANSLLLCTANASPAFIVIALGEATLRSKSLGILLFFCQTINAISLYLLLVPKSKTPPIKSTCKTVISCLIDNTKLATEQIFFVCAMTIVFGLVFDLSTQIFKGELIKLSTLIELLHGIALLEKNDLEIIAAILGFSGLCIISQCIFFIKETNLSVLYLIIGKIQAAIAMPMYITLFNNANHWYKIIAFLIIVLTNIVIMCIIKHKGCESKYDFFKKHRKMLRILRTSNKDCVQRSSSLPT